MTAVAPAPTPSAAPVADLDVRELPLAQLHAHPANRTHFDPAKLAELEDSLRRSGILTPLLVRPYQGAFQILAGHRRRLAAPKAGLTVAPCVVRELDDQTALEFVIIENLQREEVHPLEEARGYADLMKVHHYTVDRVAERVGKSTKYVYDRVKLLQLAKPLQALFFEGRITAGHAILLARLSKEDQLRCLGTEDDDYQDGGLFEVEAAQLNLETETEDDDLGPPPLKAVSVRELERWIDDNVRFDTAKLDAFLHPETAAAIQAATEEEEKVVKITYDHYVQPEARDAKERTIGPRSWKRADGLKGSKACEHAVTGVVVAGFARGQAFKVCIAKEKCDRHWKKDREEAKRRSVSGGAGGSDHYAKQQAKWEAERQARDAERARWRKALPKLSEAFLAAFKKAPAGAGSEIAKMALYQVDRQAEKTLGKPRSAEDVLRLVAYSEALEALEPHNWQLAEDVPALLKRFGIDARKIVDQVAPKPAPVQASAPAKGKAKGKKKGGAK